MEKKADEVEADRLHEKKKKKKKKEVTLIAKDGLRGGLEGIAEDKKLPKAMDISKQLKSQLCQEIENTGVVLGKRIIDLMTRDARSLH